MARRAKAGSEEAISLDSLMDALTNVVAVLILVLILVQADVTRKVVQFIDDLHPATPEQLADANQALELAEKKRAALTSLLGAAPPTSDMITAAASGVDRMRDQLAAADKRLSALRELQGKEADLRRELDDQAKTASQLSKQVAELKERLEAATAPDDTPPVEVSIPNSRPIPEKAVTYYALCHDNRVHIIDTEEALKLFTKELDRNKQAWLHERRKRKNAPDQYIYDQTKVSTAFNKLNVRNARGQRIKVVAQPTRYYLELEISPDLERGGTAMDALETKGSDFFNSAVRFQGDIRAVIIYYVHWNSFETYIKARDLSDRARIPAGWELGSQGQWRVVIPDLAVNRLQEPPANNQPQPKRPPKVDTKLD